MVWAWTQGWRTFCAIGPKGLRFRRLSRTLVLRRCSGVFQEALAMEWAHWKRIAAVVHELAEPLPGGRFGFTDAQIVLVYLWACYHDKPVSWACRKEHWPVFVRSARPARAP